MKVTVKDDLGETLVTEELRTKEFKTGSRGFYGNFKVSANGRRYQIAVQAVEIGSKPTGGK